MGGWFWWVVDVSIDMVGCWIMDLVGFVGLNVGPFN